MSPLTECDPHAPCTGFDAVHEPSTHAQNSQTTRMHIHAHMCRTIVQAKAACGLAYLPVFLCEWPSKTVHACLRWPEAAQLLLALLPSALLLKQWLVHHVWPPHHEHGMLLRCARCFSSVRMHGMRLGMLRCTTCRMLKTELVSQVCSGLSVHTDKNEMLLTFVVNLWACQGRRLGRPIQLRARDSFHWLNAMSLRANV